MSASSFLAKLFPGWSGRYVAVRLEESEQRYAQLIEQAITGFVVRRPDGQLLIVNEAYCRMTGYSREELLKLKARDMVVDPTVLDKVAALKPGESTRIETLMKCKGGAVREVQYVTQRLVGGNLQSVVVDISDRKTAERARAESEQRYQELVEQAQEGILLRRQSGELMYVNAALCQMLGYSREELLKMGIRDLVHPEDAETVEQVQRLESGAGVHLHKRMLHKGGHVLSVEVSVKRLPSGDIQSTVRDVTERARAEELFRAMVEGAPYAMLMVDERGSILMVNSETERMFRYRREELLGKPVEMLIPMKSRHGHEALRSGFHREPTSRPMGKGRDLFGLRRDGTEFPVEIGLNPVMTGEGRRVLASIIDISERKAAEARELEHQEEMRVMSQRLLEAQETERRAIARELHDEVGQALTATRLNLGKLEKDAGGGPLSVQAAESAGIVAKLLQQVRQLSLDLHPSVLDDLGLAAAMRWMVRTRTGGNELKVDLSLPDNLPRFLPVVENTAYRVFQEAFSNVLRHAEARQVTVTLTREGNSLEMQVRDDGRGFEPEAARKHALSGKSLGVLGMRERVRLAGGRIAIESGVGRGTRVHVWLPATEREP